MDAEAVATNVAMKRIRSQRWRRSMGRAFAGVQKPATKKGRNVNAGCTMKLLVESRKSARVLKTTLRVKGHRSKFRSGSTVRQSARHRRNHITLMLSQNAKGSQAFWPEVEGVLVPHV
mmetsp:Transcript_87341/g.203161  ORF Transcript_87341/g.203161 Transcript_87341/m.203161 type:complete len:118 (-) Transcript_87341:446-799(-)